MTSIRRTSPKGIAALLDVDRATASGVVEVLLVLDTNSITDATWSAAATVGDLISGTDLHPLSSSSYALSNVQFSTSTSQILLTHDPLVIASLAAPSSGAVEHAMYVWHDGSAATPLDMTPVVITDIAASPTGTGDFVISDGTGIAIWETDY